MLKKILAIGTFALAPCMSAASQLPAYPFIHASGVASQYVVPDIGEINFEISGYDRDPEVARGVVEARIAEIRSLAQVQGVAPDDIETRDVRKEMRKGNPDPAAPVAYDIKCTMHINVRDLTKWREIVLPLLNMKNLDSFATSFGASDRDAMQRTLIGEAIKDAQRNAHAMALGLGRKLGAATAVSAGSLKNLGNAMGLVATDYIPRRSSDSAKIDRKDMVTIDILEFKQPVDVIFRIK